MALDATPAGDAANSYLTVAAADALAGEDVSSEAKAWLDATADRKEAALKTATRQVDGHVRTRGLPFDAAAQLLSNRRFPRSTDIDAAGLPIIPREIELATYEQAVYLLAYGRDIAAANRRRAQGVQSASEPNLSYSRADEDPVLCAQALHFLAGFAVAPGLGATSGVGSVRIQSGFAGR